jgi:hypothetical protein
MSVSFATMDLLRHLPECFNGRSREISEIGRTKFQVFH